MRKLADHVQTFDFLFNIVFMGIVVSLISAWLKDKLAKLRFTYHWINVFISTQMIIAGIIFITAVLYNVHSSEVQGFQSDENRTVGIIESFLVYITPVVYIFVLPAAIDYPHQRFAKIVFASLMLLGDIFVALFLWQSPFTIANISSVYLKLYLYAAGTTLIFWILRYLVSSTISLVMYIYHQSTNHIKHCGDLTVQSDMPRVDIVQPNTVPRTRSRRAKKQRKGLI